MIQRLFVFVGVLFCAVGMLGCAMGEEKTAIVVMTATPTATSTNSPTSVMTVAGRQVTLTSTPANTMTSIALPSVAFTPTPLPLAPPQPVPFGFNPDPQEVYAYLRAFPVSYAYPLNVVSGSGYGVPYEDEVYFTACTYVPCDFRSGGTFYDDLNHDGLLDLIVSNRHSISIFLNNSRGYEVPFVFADSVRIGRHVKYDLADWTGDSLSETVVTSQQTHFIAGGPNSFSWYTTVIECEGMNCQVIFGYVQTRVVFDDFGQSVSIRRGEPLFDMEVPNQVSILAKYFGLYYPDPDVRVMNAASVVQETYKNEGTGFLFESKEEVTPGYAERPYVRLEDSYEGRNAVIDQLDLDLPWYETTVCRVLVDGAEIGQKFGCKKDVALIRWQEVVGDDQPEIVVNTRSGAYPTGLDGRVDDEISCVHRRLLIYQEQDGQFVEIANVAGCVRDINLSHDLRLDDWDGDGQLDIVAADRSLLTEEVCVEVDGRSDCWVDFNEDMLIYQWDGVGFVLTERIRP